MSFAALLASARAVRADEDRLDDLARLALAEGEEETALPFLGHAARRTGSARLWQWTALLQRGLDDHAAALESFAEAARRAPEDAGIANGLARTALEAGLPAEHLFARARTLGPPKSDVLLGHAAARMAAGHGDAAAAELDEILKTVPLWLDGHMQLAQVRAVLGRPDLATASLERALLAAPGEDALWRTLFDLHVRREDFSALRDAVAGARGAGRGEALWSDHQAITAAELGDVELADRLFAAERPRLIVWRIRHLLRSGRAAEALPWIDQGIAGDRAPSVWPYAAITWRMTGDPRADWLDAGGRLVSVIELGADLPALDALAARLRILHVARGEYLDQSVRGGTQTDGPLLSRIDPEIRAARAAIIGAVERHIAALPPRDPAHPTLGPRRDRRVRFAGSWSVRLRDAGHHADHVHPLGWISSALYVALPDRAAGEEPEAGWLMLGSPQAALGLDLPPMRVIEPKPGRLVLFPSWMWHGTRPFAAGERLTMAFDVAMPDP
jgi:tetratricopeptide (TPR) repeat protein